MTSEDQSMLRVQQGAGGCYWSSRVQQGAAAKAGMMSMWWFSEGFNELSVFIQCSNLQETKSILWGRETRPAEDRNPHSFNTDLTETSGETHQALVQKTIKKGIKSKDLL